MKKKSMKEDFAQLRAALKKMTFAQKVDHIWSYYKEYMAVGLLVIAVIAFAISCITSAGQKVLFSGVIANIGVSQEGMDYLRTDYFARLGGTEGKNKLDVSYIYFEDPAKISSGVESNYNAAMGVVAMVTAGTLDYLILDETALEFYINQDMFLDLSAFFSEDEMEAWKQKVIYAQPEGEEMYPVAIDISDLEFVKKNVTTAGPVYLSLSGSTSRLDTCRDFWNYLQAWSDTSASTAAAK